MLILPPKKESKIVSKEPENRLKPNPQTDSYIVFMFFNLGAYLSFLFGLFMIPGSEIDLHSAVKLFEQNEPCHLMSEGEF